MKEENEEHNKKLDSIFDQYNVKFEGSGPEVYDPTTGGMTARVEEADEDYDPFN